LKEIVIQGPSVTGATPKSLQLASGDSATVGSCSCRRCDLDLSVMIDAMAPIKGRITADQGFWLFSNLSSCTSATIENMDDWYQYIVVDPLRQDVAVPFEVAQIGLTMSPVGPKISVFSGEPRYAEPAGLAPACREDTPKRPLIDRESTYFAVLHELCVNRLRGGMDAALPTSAEIADRLRRLYPRISPGSVDAHIRYVSDKLMLPRGAGREALAAVVIRSGLLRHAASTSFACSTARPGGPRRTQGPSTVRPRRR
jgi:hypothetical protein